LPKASVTDTLKRIDGPPDTRGGTAPLPAGILVAGVASTLIATLGTLIVQLVYAWTNVGGMTPGCEQELTITLADGDKLVQGAEGVCNIVRAVISPTQTFLFWIAIGVGLGASAAGIISYRRMPSRRMRNQCISGAVLGVQSVVLVGFLMWFRSGNIFDFARNFLNLGLLNDSLDGFVRGAKNTLQLAFLGEIGGIVVGLLLAVLVISQHRVVRAPARMYINFFRGTPLIWQLPFFYYLLIFGFDLRLDVFTIATIVFVMNTGAYAAEVFRAGIESIDKGQMEAARSLGMSYLQAMRFAIVPQAVRRVIPPLMNEFVILIKDTALIVVLGLTADQLDIFGYARQGYASSFNATFFTATAAAYLVVTLPLIRLVNYVESRLRSGMAGRV
jgi:His/Glu/Gln/Arg/opine family amino acid ABC transporter permease subunit